MSTVFKVLTRPWAWFRSSPQTDYEEVLSSLSAQIDHVQTNLVSIQLRRRRATIILPLWASLFWAIYTVAAYFAGLLGSRRLDEEGNTLLVWGPILLAPLVIFFTRRIVRWWYKRVQVAEDEHLKELKRQRNVKIEEIKRATRYDHLRMLLDKYDEDGARKAPGTTAPVGAGRTPNTKQQQQQQGSPQPRTPVKGQAATQPNTPQQRSMPGAHATPVLRADGTPVPPTASAGAVNGAPAIIRPPLPSAMPTQRTWLDRVADAVLGSDPSSAVLGPEQKYALICSKCKTHNGLATREEFEEVQYICPHCGTFNTRRPSSVPVSSPWKTNSSTPIPASRLSRQQKNPSSSLRPSSRLMDDVDSPPPSSPLARPSSSDLDEDEGEGQEKEGEQLLSAGSSHKLTGSNRATLNQRKAAGAIDTGSDDVEMSS